ncbi:CoA pyrophosphatase [Niallia sp. XMNu-256]|uniref:NUDIX hydrolase n=1 Tax=Niallia sp. XMNu-256 TaxID=3082444 RepID=UPI0030D20F77
MELSKVITKLSGHKPNILGHKELQTFAVLLPLLEKNNETHVLFEVRSMNLRRQPGEICFPGGKMEKDDPNHSQCAIRETSEELGISEEEIANVMPLDFMANATGNIIYPFVGTIKNPDKIKPNQLEVGEVFTVPLNYFLTTEPEVYKIHFKVVPEENFPLDLLIGGENYKWQIHPIDEYFYQYNGKVIWGLTAKILVHFLSILKND